MYTLHVLRSGSFSPLSSKGKVRKFATYTEAQEKRDKLGRRQRITAQIINGTGATQGDRDRLEALEALYKLVKPGDTLYTSVSHVSRSGMSRNIGVYKLLKGDRLWLSRLTAKATGHNMKGDDIQVGGCGMDMGFSVVYDLSSRMFPGGFACTGNRCPSNDHSNRHELAPGENHSCGGYALRQAWL